MEGRIRALLEPIADELGVTVLQVNLGGGEHIQMVRVVLDRRGGVDSDVLERISRALSLQLDAEDLVAGHYRLEITSPGLGWPLITADDFLRHQGEWLKVMFCDGSAVEGDNLGPVEGGFGLHVPGEGERQVDMADVVKVTRAINWKAVSGKKK